MSVLREDDNKSKLQSDEEEELEPPLPLKADGDWQHHSPYLAPQHHMYKYGKDNICNFLFVY